VGGGCEVEVVTTTTGIDEDDDDGDNDDNEGSCPNGKRPSPGCDDVVLEKTKRLTCFLRKRGFSTSSAGRAGAASATPNTGSNVESMARAAAIIIEDLRIMVARCSVSEEGSYYWIG